MANFWENDALAPAQVAPAANWWQGDKLQSDDFAARAAGMSHQQLVDAYRQTRPGDPWGDYLAKQISQPMQGESPSQTEARLHGTSSYQPMSKLGSAIVGAGDTMAFGGLDEGTAALNSVLTGTPYDQNLEASRAVMRQYHDDNPWSYTGGQVVGVALPALATGGGSTGGSLGGNMLRGAASGAAQGAAYGFGSGEGGFENRAINAGENGIAGGVMGGAAPLAGKAIGSAWNAAAKGWQGLGDWLAGSGMDTKAANTILAQMQAAGHTPESAAQLMDKLGPDAMLADAMPSFTAQTARATNEAASTIGDALASRRAASPGRLSGDLDATFGPVKDPYAVRTDIRAQKAVINPQYTAAINGNSALLPKSVAEFDPQLANMVSGMSAGNRNAMASHVAAIDDALSASSPQEQASRLLDLRHALDAQITYDPRQLAMLSPAERASQGVTRQARAMVDDILKQNVPGIAEADAAHAPLSAQQQAFDFGRKQLLAGGQNAISPGEASARLAAMNDAERNMVAQGVRAETARVMGNASNNPASAADRILGRDWNQQKVAGLVGQEPASNLANALDRESTFNETSKLAEPGLGSRTSVTQNNPWVPQQGNGQSIWRDMALGGVAGFQAGGPKGAALGVAAPVGKRLWSALRGAGQIDPALVGNVAQKLVAQGGVRDRLVAALADTSMRNGGRVARSAAIERLANALSAPVAQITARHGSGVAGSALARAGLLPQPQ